MILAAPSEKDAAPPASGGGGSYDKKTQSEQAKKDYILRRFISYNPVKQPSR
jgi:hypothetical protein